MGRKIPAKKHRGVKDPLVQQAKRLESLKGKINAPPKDPDEQPVPRSLTRLFAFRDQDTRISKVKKNTHPGRRPTQNKNGSASDGASNPISRLHKLPGESGRAFSLRINSAVKALHNPGEELHYPADIEADDEKGLRMMELRERRARKRRRAGAGSLAAGSQAAGSRAAGSQAAGARTAGARAEPSLSRTQRLALKKKAKKIKASEAINERPEVVYERVSFGDVTHGPPSLQPRARGAARPGRRDLLLTRLLAGGPPRGPGGPPREAGGPPAAREAARLQAVAAYRALKASKLKLK